MPPFTRCLQWPIGLLFLLSGATGLAYEVIWFKRFAHLWGNSSLALAAVVASFLFGLGLGAQVIGRWADCMRAPLRWYGISELAIGLLAALVPWQTRLLAAFAGRLEAPLSTSPAALLGLRVALTFLMVGPPCFLMGGTLPLLVRQCAVTSASDAIGWLYGINTLGAAMGCYLAGFHWLPRLGLFWTNNLAAALNLVIGLAAIALARRLVPVATTVGPGGLRDASADSTNALARPPGRWTILGAALLTGTAALMLQMVWVRQLSLALGGSTYAYSAMLFVVLLGIALGGVLHHAWLRRLGSPRKVAAGVVLVLAICTVSGQQRLPWLCDQAGVYRAARAEPWGNSLLCLGESAVLELIPSIAGGILLPLLVQLIGRSNVGTGRIVGNVYATNTLGALVGAVITAQFLFPALGVWGACGVALLLYAAAALLLLPWSALGTHRLMFGMAAATLICAALAIQRSDPRLTDMGAYLYGRWPVELRMEQAIKFFREGSSSNVLVTKISDHHALRVNGKIDAGTEQDMATQVGLAYFPRAFQPDAKDVLIIGYGSGATVGASLLFPETRVVCCEIEPAIFAASPWFAKVNHRPERSPRLEMRFDDGRSYLQRTMRTFDLIISEPSNPWLAGVSNLFTQEFFQVVRERLRDGGLFAQWIQTYNFSLDEYALAVRTLRSVFPHLVVILLPESGDSIFLSSSRPLTFGPKRQSTFQRLVDSLPAVRGDLNRHFKMDDVRAWFLRYCGPDQASLAKLPQFAAALPLNTDLNMRLEFDAPLRLFDPRYGQKNELLPRLLGLRDRTSLERLVQSMEVRPDTAIYDWALGNERLREGRTGEALEQFRRAIERDSTFYPAYYDLAAACLAEQDVRGAIDAMTRLVPLRPDDAQLRASLGGLLVGQRDFKAAIRQFRDALRIDPDSVIVQMNLAWVLATCPDAENRNGREAVALAEAACRATDYYDAYCLDTLAAALAESGEFDRAAHLEGEAIKELQLRGEPTVEVQARLALFQQQRPYRER